LQNKGKTTNIQSKYENLSFPYLERASKGVPGYEQRSTAAPRAVLVSWRNKEQKEMKLPRATLVGNQDNGAIQGMYLMRDNLREKE